MNIRNFCIISHIDAGKSTLADRFLELTGTVDKKKMRPQYLDMMDLEREKGITIKMQPVSMIYRPQPHSEFLLNLIDTPGHVDFNYEVSRSLTAVEGAILLVDATKGIQAQTIGNLELARKQNLVIIPVINKIDSPLAKIEETKNELIDLLNIDPNEIIEISAKEGKNIDQLLEAVLKKIPCPLSQRKETNIFRALIFDSKYDPYKGAIAFVRIFDGKITKKEKIYLMGTKIQSEVKEVGVFKPELTPVEKLSSGEIGYIATGIKEPEKVRVGDTISILGQNPQPLPGYFEPKPVVFLSIYSENPDDFDLLKNGLEKLKLNDAAISFKPESKEGLGRGFQCGFLGMLHAEIIIERLRREFKLNLIVSTPQVVYKIISKDGKEIFIYNPKDWPSPTIIKESQEIWIRLRILIPLNYFGSILKLLESINSKLFRTNYLGKEKLELIYEAPLREIITKNFYDQLKSISQGFGSMDYEILGWRIADLQKLDILILGKKEEALSRILPSEEIPQEARRMVEKLKEILPPQLFPIPIQAAIEGKIIARVTIKARKRDVIAPLYGGDYTRKRKLLEKQKRGKQKLKEKAISLNREGKIKIPPQIFLEMLKY